MDLGLGLSAASILVLQIQLAEIKEPAIVLFKYAGDGHSAEEPVYNMDVANPDDAPIIRAHDLGARNIELFDYYARIAPQRMVYRYDRDTCQLMKLGTVVQLAERR